MTTALKFGSLNYRRRQLDNWRWIPRAFLIVLTALGFITAHQLIAPTKLAAQMNQDQMEKTIQDPNRPWQLEADEINYDQNLDEYSARGNVLIYKGNIKLLADFVRFDHKNMKTYAEGDVIFTNGEDILSGTRMEMDMEKRLGSVENGYLFIKENNFHLTGNLIKKVGEKTYTIDEATLTSCDGENPDWKITGKRLFQTMATKS